MTSKLESFTDILGDPESDEIEDSQPMSLSSVEDSEHRESNSTKVSAAPTIPFHIGTHSNVKVRRPARGTGQHGEFRSVEEIDAKYRSVFSYPFFNIVQSRVIEDALYSDKSMVVCAPTGSGKTVVFEMAIVQLLMELEDRKDNLDFKIIYMAPIKALCTERLTEWYSKFTKLGLLCIEVTGDTDVDFSQLKPYRIIITTPEKWDMLTRRWRDHRQLVEVIKLFLIDEVHILNDESRGPVLEAVVSRMKTIETSVQSTYRIQQLQHQHQGTEVSGNVSPNIRFVAVSATVSNPEDVAAWLGTTDKPAVYYKFGDECRPVKLRRVVEGYSCAAGASTFKFDLVLNYKLWPIIQKYYNGKPTLIFCNTRKSVELTAETLSREITINFNEEQKARLTALASAIKNKKLQTLVLSGVGCHHAGLLYEERTNIEHAFRNLDLPILITTTTLAMGVNLPAHLVIIKNTQQYVSGAYQEYSMSTVLQMVGRAGRPQFDTEATAVIMTRLADKPRYQALVGGSEPLQSFLQKRLPENLNSEAASGTVSDVAQCVQWLHSTFLSVRAAKDPKRYLGLPQTAPHHQISKKIEELCVIAMNGLASTGLITMDEACCIESTEAGRLMSIYYLDLETMKHIMKISGSESLEQLLWVVCESHELAAMHLRMDERRCLNALNRNKLASTIRFPMKGKIVTRQMKLNCVIQAVLGCLPIPDPSLNQEAMKIMRIAERVCKCLVAYVTRPTPASQQSKFYSAVLNSIILAKCVAANLWENSHYVAKQLKGIGPTFSTLLATAGKINFMLLEESHPRDLERIMNKGPPAGNIIRNQISLLPKYQLTITPIDEKSVSIQLVLLNHHNLSENLGQLTAGATHKSYVIIGDTENNLLLLTSFNDKDLIGVYNGSITYTITRKYGFEHKIYAHCISATIAGIDAYIEYVFKDIEPQTQHLHSENNEGIIKKPIQKQTAITDTFRERKRKNTENELTQSKEKKKRESALFEKFKNLKESFGKTSNALKEDLDRYAVMSNMTNYKLKQDLTNLENRNTEDHPYTTTEQNYSKNQEPPVKSSLYVEPNTYEINEQDFINDEFMDDDKINNILNEIECEISKEEKPGVSNKKKSYSENESIIQKIVISKPVSMKYDQGRNTYSIESYKNDTKKKNYKNVPKKSNFNFIGLLEKNVDLSDEEITVNEPNSFSDTIRCHIDKYLQKAKTRVKAPDRILTDLIQEEPVAVTSKETVPVVILQDSIINKSFNKDSLNTNTQLESDIKSIRRENPTIIDVVEDLTINDTSKPLSVLENKIKSIDLTADESLNVDEHTQDFNKEHELPAINLFKDDSKHDIAILNTVEKRESVPDNDQGKHDVTINKNIELAKKPISITPVPKNTEDIGIEQPSSNLESSLPYHVNAVVPFIGPNVKDLFSKNISKAPTVYTCPIVLQSSHTSEVKEKKHEIHPARLLLQEQVEKEYQVEQNVVYNKSNGNKLIALPNTINRVPELNNKPKLPVMELCKSFFKKLPPLQSERNNNEVSTEENYNSNRLLVDSPGACSHVTKVKDDLILPTATEIPKYDNKVIFVQPYKYTDTAGSGSQPFSQVNSRNKPTILSKTPQINESQRLFQNIEQSKCMQEIRTYNAPTSTFGNQSTSIYQNIHENNVLPSTSFATELGITAQERQALHYRDTNSRTPTTSAIGNRPSYAEENYNFNYSNANTQKHFINKYSFSSNSIDVSTKTTADHVVRITRKCKMYLDVTETVTEKNKTTGNKGVDTEEQIDNDEVTPNIAFKKPNMTIAPNTENRNEKTNSTVTSYSTEVGKSIGIDNPKTLPNFDNSTTVQKFSENKCFPPSYALPATGPTNFKNDTTSVELIDEHSQFKEGIDNNGEKNIFIEYKIPNLPLQRKPKTIESVLLKYSNIARNHIRKDPSTSQTKADKNIQDHRKKEKPKRPFKISDIDRLDATPLLDAFIEKPKIVDVTKCFNLLEPNDKHNQLQQNRPLNIFPLPTPKELVVEHEYNEGILERVDKNIETLRDTSLCDPSACHMALETKDTISDIDQTMFNPKTLLQCFSKDESEDILPPPPEFSEYLNTSTDPNADVTLPMDCYEPMVWEEEMEVSEGIHNRNIFKEGSTVEQTPSKEIKTWNLTQDESCEMYASSGTSPYSFTTMRKNKEQTAQNNSLMQNATHYRQNKLKQFKFSHKKKFKFGGQM